MINKVGKIGKLNQKETRELVKEYDRRDIRYCEIRLPLDPKFPKCSPLASTFVHRHKKHWYLGKPDELRWSYMQTLKGCMGCHGQMEFNKELTERIFAKLRPGDELKIKN